MAERKLKVILFGVTEFQYGVARGCIDLDKCEIIACADNDNVKHSLVYESLEIISPDTLLYIDFDYILVGAWFSYNTIQHQLIEIGIDPNKILPLLAEKCISLLIEPIEINYGAIRRVFINSERILKKFEIVNQINALYKNINMGNGETKEYTNFAKYPLIAHACGGFVNGEHEEYTNSLEAFEEAMSSGFNMFECDVWGKQDEQIVLGSRLKMQWPINIDYTIFSLNTLLNRIAVYPEKRVVLDIKWNTYDDFYRLLDSIEQLVHNLEDHGFPNIKKQIIVETFDEITTRYAVEKQWECVLTDYRNPEGDWIKNTAVLCCKYTLRTVFLNAGTVMRNMKYIHFLLEKGIDIVSYTVDNIETYASLRQAGVTSVLTNFLKPSLGLEQKVD